MDAELGFGSNASVMTNCFPMFLGKFMSRWSNTSVGILFSAMTIKIFETGLSVIKVSATGQQVCTMTLFLGLLIFLANENVFKNSKARKERITEAATKKATLALA
jgi:ribose transport system permease protein